MPWIKCLGGAGGKPRRGKPLSVSQPIHLLVKSDFEPQCHVFRTKQLRKPRPCHLCHQAVIKQASCCRVCKYICHKTCEDKGARFRDTSQQIHKQWQADPARAFPTVGSVTTNVGSGGGGGGGGSPSPASGDISTPNSTPSPSPSPTNGQLVMHNGGYESQPKNVNTIARNKQQQQQQQQLLMQQHQHQLHQQQVQTVQSSGTPARTPGVGADSSSVDVVGKGVSGGRVTEVMELCYVTERIIALWYREDAQGVLEHATTLLRGKHADNYMIFNLSSPGRTGESNTREAGWPQGLAPSLERLCALCKELDSWLNGLPNRVVVLHARGNKERLGVAVSAYMNYSSICGGRDQALDRFAMRRFLDDKIGSLQVPSHRRYIEYFSGLLSGSLRISQSPLYLTHLTVLGVPLFEPTGCRAFLKVYEGLTPVYTSDLYSVTNAREFTVNLGGLRLRGDILVKCYHRVYSKQSREVMFSLQFHTCVITENVVSFPRSELDVACEDPRCPPDSVVTLYFATDAKRQDGPIPAPTPAVPHASAHHDPILHWDSYTNLEISDDEGRETPLSPPPPSNSSVQTSPRGLGYTCGPIDGSLYAVVHQGAAGGARGSPLTVSMDSGISSAPPQRPSPPEHEPDNQAHGDLDKLLHDMMLTVESMPDPPIQEDYSRTDRNDKIYVQENRSYSSHTNSSHGGASTYSTLKDSYRSYSVTKESSPPYNSSSSYSTLKNEYRDSPIKTNNEHRRDDYEYHRVSPDRKLSESSADIYGRKQHVVESFSPSGNIDFIDEDIPYHARQTSQPFSYGATTDMIKHQKLSSPSLVRKASVRGNAPMVDFDDILGDVNSRRPISPLSPNTPDPPPEFANGPVKTSTTTTMTTTTQDHVDGLSWLRQQQLKLAARRDEKSPKTIWRQETGNRVIGELRSYQRGRLRQDGYASDSAVLDDDDDTWIPSSLINQTQSKTTPYTSAPASPLLPQRSSSRKYNGSSNASNALLGRPRAESMNERPFVSVKRAYEYRKYNDGQSHNDSASSWTERSVSPGSTVGVSRPQTPAFPVHPRTPYVNNASPTVTFASDRGYVMSNNSYNINNNNNNSMTGIEASGGGNSNNNNLGNYNTERTVYIEERREVSKETGLPPKSPTTQRRLSFPASGPLKQMHNKRWPLTNQSASFDYSKDRPVSPISESAISQAQAISHNPGTPTHVEFAQSPKSATSYTSINSGGQSSPQVQYYGSRRSSIHSNSEPQEVADVNVKFVRDTSRIWYKPNISREQAISMLKDATPGTFVVRDSNSFPGAFGLALKVATPPPGAPSSPRDPSSELVRHFLIEPTSRGVRLKGCANEPVFSSLSALVYQHSLMAMALPCQLLLPEPEAAARALDSPATNSAQQLLAQGAACNVLYLFTVDTESLTGPQAIKKAISTLFEQKPLPSATIVHFKVSTQGITLTDNARKLFFRRHYPTNNISYCGLDTEERTWDFSGEDAGRPLSAHRCFGFVARKPAHKSDNQCHVFAELEPEQPATAIVNFVNKVMMGNSIAKANIV
ncbi:PREDICTED: tensin-3 isoform X10 [Polistes dominula]|uniref:Tensin-3 isoform X10 n=1 Tax=Polistes dominula TaxID=743375 RepID=A0ABM1I7W8_POLDO|nr:PREDICTED: tensin-3 isoform X10 [Polistes dominula]